MGRSGRPPHQCTPDGTIGENAFFGSRGGPGGRRNEAPHHLSSGKVEPIDFDADADVVAISFMTFNAPRAYEIARAFRRRGKTVIVGGYHPTLLPQEAALHADAVCVGEAEANLPSMLGDVRANRLRKIYDIPYERLEPSPIEPHLLARGKYAPCAVVQATRGCPNGCAFCSVSAFSRRTFKSRPVADVVGEIRRARTRRVLFMDDHLAADRAYAESLLRALVPLGRRWYAQIGAGVARDPGFLRLLARSGCQGVFVGFDHDGPETFDRTSRFLRETGVEALQLTILTPFPGTPVFERMEGHDRILREFYSRRRTRSAGKRSSLARLRIASV